MQALLTRALQVKSSCGCPSCLSAPARALGRRTNPSAARQSRVGNEAFTVFYSSVVAAALAVDAHWKTSRRELLDEAIIHAREELKVLDEGQKNRLEALAHNDLALQKELEKIAHDKGLDISLSHLENDSVQPLIKEELPPTQPPNGSQVQAKAPKLSVEKQAATDSERLAFKTGKGKVPRKDRAQSEQEMGSILAALLDSRRHEDYKGKTISEAWNSRGAPSATRRNTLLRETAMSKLMFGLVLHYLRIAGRDAPLLQIFLPSGKVLRYSRDSISDLIQQKKDLSYRRRLLVSSQHAKDLLDHFKPLNVPNYLWSGEDYINQEENAVAHQDSEMLEILREKSSLNQLFSRMCSAIAHQQYAPSIHSLNHMLIELCRLNLHQSAESVIEAIRDSGLVPNEVTHAAVLNSFVHSGKYEKFVSWLNMMDGVDGFGLLPAKRANLSKTTSAGAKDFLIDCYYSRVHAVDGYQRDNKALETRFLKVPRNLEIYEATVVGYLRFGNLGKAMQEYSKLLRCQTVPSSRVFRAFLRHCVATRSWVTGQAIWARASEDRITRPILYWMLQLCAVCNRQKEFDAIIRDAIRQNVIPAPLCMSDFDLSNKEIRKMVFCEADLADSLNFGDGSMAKSSRKPAHQVHAEGGKLPANLATFNREFLLEMVHRNSRDSGFCINDKGWPISRDTLGSDEPFNKWLTITTHREIRAADNKQRAQGIHLSALQMGRGY